MTENYDNQIFVVNKETGPTSFDVVAQMRKAAGLRKVGHTGTLDPLANGVLLLCTGKATRASDQFMELEKEYVFTVRLGAETSTLDAEGEVVREGPVPEISEEDVKTALTRFVGEYEMLPPAYSAIKIDGKRLYELARRGETPEIPTRVVMIHEFELVELNLPDITLRVRCSRGTYVRSLAQDLAGMLGAPGHVIQLTRTRVGPFTVDDAFPSIRIANQDIADLNGHSMADALSFLPGVVLSSRSKRGLRFGLMPTRQDVLEVIGEILPGAVRILDASGTLLAIGKRNDDDTHDRLRIVDTYRLFVELDYLTENGATA